MNRNAAHFHAPSNAEEPSEPSYFSVARAAAARLAHRRQLERELEAIDQQAAAAAAELDRLQRIRSVMAAQLARMTA